MLSPRKTAPTRGTPPPALGHTVHEDDFPMGLVLIIAASSAVWFGVGFALGWWLT